MIDEAVARLRATDDEWALGVLRDRCPTLVYTCDYDQSRRYKHGGTER